VGVMAVLSWAGGWDMEGDNATGPAGARNGIFRGWAATSESGGGGSGPLCPFRAFE